MRVEGMGWGRGPGSGLRRIRHPVLVLQVVAAVLMLTYLASTILRERNTTSTFFDSWVGNLGYASCTALCAWRAVAVPQQRRAWATIALSLGLFTAGAVLWTTTVQNWDPVPYPSISDAFFLAFYPVAYLGVGFLIRATIPMGSRAIWLDGLIAALGVAALEASIVIAGISRSNQGDAATVATNLAYPIGDLVLVMMLVAVFSMRGWRPERLWWLLGAGLAIFAIADTVYVYRVTDGSYVTGTPLDSLWLIGALLISLAAWLPAREEPREPVEPRHEHTIVIPAFFLLTSLGIVVTATWRPVLPLGVVLATGTLILAIFRMAQAFFQLQALAESKRMARTDELTGLANRRAFYEELHRCLNDSARQRLGLLMIDLDRFKEINDSLGHAVGDDILRQLGPRLASAVGERGIVARIGGDEFGLLLAPLTDAVEASDLAGSVCDILRVPFTLEAMAIRLDASVGIALAPQDGAVPEALVRKADIAMYSAKRAKKRWAFYAAEADMNSRERLELMEDLRDAIDGGEMTVYYQPKVDLRARAVIGVEALVRWDHPSRGLVPPSTFLPLVEESGHIGPLALTVLEQALDQKARWAEAGTVLSVAVNLSPTNLLDDELPAKVDDIIGRHGKGSGGLVFEITEDCLMTDAERSLDVLEQLRSMGLELSIDDYGTGFSSLAYLRQIPASELKLDRSFVAGTTGDRRTISIVRSTVELSHSLGLRIVAEGVETVDELELVTELGCDMAQGYLLGKPVPAADLVTTVPIGLEGWSSVQN